MSDLIRIHRWPLHWQILLGLVIGAAIGFGLGNWGISQIPVSTDPSQRGRVAATIVTSNGLYLVLDLVGDLFIQGLKLIIVPLVTSSIMLAVASIATGSDFKRLGIKTLSYYMLTSLVAITIGLTLIDIFKPGIGSDGRGILQGKDLAAFAEDQKVVEAKGAGKTGSDFLNVFREMVPANIVEAAASDKLLGLIVVSLAVGYFLSKYTGPGGETVRNFVTAVYDITLAITDVVLKLAPIGVIGLIACTVGEQFAKLKPDARFAEFAAGIGKFALVAFCALMIHMLVTFPIILSWLGRINPIRHYRAMTPALTMAFSTASSSATLPVTLNCVEKRCGVSNRIASFTLPLGATVNMDGTALYECVAAMFICQAFGIELSMAQQFMIVITALLTSIGVAGVPAASLVAIIVILNGVQNQLPADAPLLIGGLGMLFVFDRPLDMCRTAVNIFSDSVGAVTIARSEGETTLLASGQEPA